MAKLSPEVRERKKKRLQATLARKNAAKQAMNLVGEVEIAAPGLNMPAPRKDKGKSKKYNVNVTRAIDPARVTLALELVRLINRVLG